jgi:ferritin-like metal-binding protein YciE
LEEIMAQQTSDQVIERYLQDAIAAEQNFENQLRTFSAESDQAEVKALFAQHAEETKRQHERLTARLTALGGSPSGMKGFLAHLFGFAPKTAQVGHEEAEKSTQDLMMAFAVENSEIAMYEALATAADAAGDMQTAALAREIQGEERMAAEKVWNLIVPSARDAFYRVTTGEVGRRAA